MSDYQQGRVSGIFSLGSRIEDLGEAYEKEAQSLDSMKIAFGMAAQTLETYAAAHCAELDSAKIPIKEGEYGKVYIIRCLELVKKLFNDAEAKRLSAHGSHQAIKQAVAVVKGCYDDERLKLEAHKVYEADVVKNPKDRPVGVDPGNPLEEYKKASEADVTIVSAPKKKQRKRKTR
jgi:hypothetical protein